MINVAGSTEAWATEPMHIVLILLMGHLQFYSALFLAKYFDFAFYPAYGLLALSGLQILSFWANLWHSVFSRVRVFLYPLYFLSLLLLSMSFESMPVALMLLAGLFIFAFTQSEIISILNSGRSEISTLYSGELIGGILGVLSWLTLSTKIGFSGYATLAAATMFLNFGLQEVNNLNHKKPARVRAALLLSIPLIALVGFVREPEPVVNKRDRSQIVRAGTVVERIWDPNGFVELVNFSPSRHLLLFDGGELRSNISKFDGNFERLKSDYQNSCPTNTWGLDVILPHFIHGRSGTNVALISAIGGQEILAARAFGAALIDVIDINGAAQRIMVERENDFSGKLYDGVLLHHEDGRSFIENSEKKFDIIQIYSSESAAFSSAFGANFRPSSLLTEEALRTYDRHLAEDGVLQITSAPFEKMSATFQGAFRDHNQNLNEQLFIYRRDANTDLISFAFKKNGWTAEERATMTNWLVRDTTNRWKTLEFPVYEKYSEPNFLSFSLRSSTDNWPFAKIFKDRDFELRLFYFLVASLVAFILYFVTRWKSVLRRKAIEGSFWMGASYSVAQSLAIISMQKVVGLPALGLGLAIAGILTLTAVAARFTESRYLAKFPRNLVSLLALAITPAYLLSKLSGLLVVAVLVVLQSAAFTRLLGENVERINVVFWVNGLGFAFGILAFNLIFAFFGLWQATLLLTILYFLISLSNFSAVVAKQVKRV